MLGIFVNAAKGKLNRAIQHASRSFLQHTDVLLDLPSYETYNNLLLGLYIPPTVA